MNLSNYLEGSIWYKPSSNFQIPLIKKITAAKIVNENPALNTSEYDDIFVFIKVIAPNKNEINNMTAEIPNPILASLNGFSFNSLSKMCVAVKENVAIPTVKSIKLKYRIVKSLRFSGDTKTFKIIDRKVETIIINAANMRITRTT